MGNLYQELIKRQRKELGIVPMFFAINDEQFIKGMQKLGLTENDTDKVYRLGYEMYYKKSDQKILEKMIKKHNKELINSIKNDKTGEGFVFDMFRYELMFHLYGYTQEINETLDTLNLSIEDIENNKNLRIGLEKAIATIPLN